VGGFVGALAALVAGGALATASVIGVVQMQSGTPDASDQQGSVSSQIVDYGTDE
jgi:hypothetical protein